MTTNITIYMETWQKMLYFGGFAAGLPLYLADY